MKLLPCMEPNSLSEYYKELSVSWARWTHFISHFLETYFIIILPPPPLSHLQIIPIKIGYIHVYHFFCSCCMHHLLHPPFCGHRNKSICWIIAKNKAFRKCRRSVSGGHSQENFVKTETTRPIGNWSNSRKVSDKQGSLWSATAISYRGAINT